MTFMADAQFRRQVEGLVERGYPELLGVGAGAFRTALEPLIDRVPRDADDADGAGDAGDACGAGGERSLDPENGTAPFVLVINSKAAPARSILPLVERKGKSAIEKLYPIEPEQFRPIDALDLPGGIAYLLLDIDRGRDTLNVTPNDALDSIQAGGRSPLTIEEGIALLTHYPDFLQPNNCFMLLGSRCGDKRVPAFWLSEGRPKLGWCWAGNPHTWLGSASGGGRSDGVEVGVGEGVV